MTIEEIAEWFESDDVAHYGKAPEADKFVRLRLALELIGTICRKHETAAEHDVIYVGQDIIEECVTPEILQRLAELGVHWEDDVEGFAVFT